MRRSKQRERFAQDAEKLYYVGIQYSVYNAMHTFKPGNTLSHNSLTTHRTQKIQTTPYVFRPWSPFSCLSTSLPLKVALIHMHVTPRISRRITIRTQHIDSALVYKSLSPTSAIRKAATPLSAPNKVVVAGASFDVECTHIDRVRASRIGVISCAFFVDVGNSSF